MLDSIRNSRLRPFVYWANPNVRRWIASFTVVIIALELSPLHLYTRLGAVGFNIPFLFGLSWADIMGIFLLLSGIWLFDRKIGL